MADGKVVLYVGAAIPKLSETFVYREILALRKLGVDVATASVHPPEREPENEELESLADASIPVYGAGKGRLLLDAFLSLLTRPLRFGTLFCGIGDALTSRDIPRGKRLKLLWQCLAGLALARRVRGSAIGHVHAHMAHVPASVAMYCARALRVPFSFTGHAVDLFAERTLLGRKLTRAVFTACISEWHRTFYQDVVPLDDTRLPVVRCGIDLDAFRPSEDERESPPLVASVGRMVPKKGFDLLLRALAVLRDAGVEFRAVIVGDGPELEPLLGLRRVLDLERVVDLPGARKNDEVRELVASADLFVLPCRVDQRGDRDGIPVVLMEAMACAVPVVTGDIVTIRELVENDESGYLIQPEDEKALSRHMLELLSNPDRRAELGRKGRARIEEEFGLTVNARRMAHAMEIEV